MKVLDGGLRFYLFMETNDGRPFMPNEKQMEALFAIPDVEEVSSDQALTYKVVFKLDSMNEFTPERLQQSKEAVLAAISRRSRPAAT